MIGGTLTWLVIYGYMIWIDTRLIDTRPSSPLVLIRRSLIIGVLIVVVVVLVVVVHWNYSLCGWELNCTDRLYLIKTVTMLKVYNVLQCYRLSSLNPARIVWWCSSAEIIEYWKMIKWWLHLLSADILLFDHNCTSCMFKDLPICHSLYCDNNGKLFI